MRHEAGRPIVLILAVFLVLGVTYSVVNPLFESPDEVWHYEYVRWLVEGRGLPAPAEVGTAPWHQEGSQPPLYYLAAAALTKPISTANASSVIRYNPHAEMGQPGSAGNKNVMVHGEAEAWPWQGVALAAHVARFFSLLLGACTVLCTYLAALTLFPGRRSLAGTAACLVAFNPQFLFVSAAVNNDNLVTACSAAGIWLALRLILGGKLEGDRHVPITWVNGGKLDGDRHVLSTGSRCALSVPVTLVDETFRIGADRSVRREDLLYPLLLGALTGAAGLSKLSGLALAAVVALAVAWRAWRSRSIRLFVLQGSAAALAALAVGGWWYVRNWLLYGDPLGLQAMFDVMPARSAPPGLAELLNRGQGVWRSAWGVFGWFNVPAPDWVIAVYSAVCLAGLAGLLFLAGRAAWRRTGARPLARSYPVDERIAQPERGAGRQIVLQPKEAGDRLAGVLLLAAWLAVVVIALLAWAQMRYPQGRLLFPALPAAAVLLAAGLRAWLPGRVHRAVVPVLGACLVGLAAAAPFLWIAPAYARPAAAQVTSLPRVRRPVDFAVPEVGGIRLLGYRVDAAAARPGGRVPVTLYWQAAQTVQHDYSVFVHLVDENGIIQAQDDSYPAGGNWPTSEWQPGVIVPDLHTVDVPETAPAPLRLRVVVGIFDFAGGQRLAVRRGNELPLGYVSLAAAADQTGLHPVDFDFDGKVALHGFHFDQAVLQPGGTLTVTMEWQWLQAGSKAAGYTAFVHLLLPPNAVWAQEDRALPAVAAAGASSPGTFVETYRLALPPDAPPGTYQIEIGVYDPATMDRLPVDFRDQGIVLGEVRVAGEDSDPGGSSSAAAAPG